MRGSFLWEIKPTKHIACGALLPSVALASGSYREGSISLNDITFIAVIKNNSQSESPGA